jgi:hypothetical protein
MQLGVHRLKFLFSPEVEGDKCPPNAGRGISLASYTADPSTLPWAAYHALHGFSKSFQANARKVFSYKLQPLQNNSFTIRLYNRFVSSDAKHTLQPR